MKNFRKFSQGQYEIIIEALEARKRFIQDLLLSIYPYKDYPIDRLKNVMKENLTNIEFLLDILKQNDIFYL